MFDFLDMIGTYEDRKVDRFETDLFTIDTAYVTDREHPYETAIAHTKFNAGGWIILGWRDTKEEAQKYHDEMIQFFKDNPDIEQIVDVYDNVVYERKGED